MFILFGFGHRTSKSYGSVTQNICANCKNYVKREVVKFTSWFTLFFIPIIPYSTEYALCCPICKRAEQLSKAEFNEIIDEGLIISDVDNKSDKDKYRGKTETQIAYLKQMEEFKAERELRNKNSD